MIQLIALKNDIGIEIREKFSVIQKRCESSLKKLSQICEEVVMISTCNRTEIYFNSSYDDLSIVEKIFETLNWDKSLMKYICHHKEEKAVRHLMDVVCGFDSLILGEDQILAQVKEAYETARTAKTVHKELQKLFLTAITCGKEFRTKSNLYKIPVSSSSIAVSESRKKAMNRFMILGFGEVGKLTAKYIMSGDFEVLYIAVRDISMVNIEDSRVKVIPFEKRLKYYEDVNCIISCTSAPHTVIKKDDLPNNRNMLLFDLAVPRDLDRDVCDLKNVQVYDIDTVSLMDDNNRKLRKDIMKENRLILEKYIKEFEQWQSLQSISLEIVKLKQAGERVYKERYKTFRNKKDTKDTDKLAEVLLKSTSDAFINKAIEVLKEEQLKGRVSDCMKIIQRIFYVVE
ncbi:glutamyl-tRNA reductase [Clostridium sp. CX1]|uniref:glutamyl-tRNA reductase n=1 Tax=Clostridium sp. CX1 TaxID=2978346 RepID=UPI0021BF198D|nr:glutamyl-tRNA reductase [Clostridium sp. CX1]MCT8976637.1 glutamyl-tRNA reductase [Clostridium sp. CX1]